MRHEQDHDEVAAPASAASSFLSIAASILLAAFAATGIYAVNKASNVYGSAPSDLVSVNSVNRASGPRNEGPTWDYLDSDQQTILMPLQEHWTWLTEQQKRRWILIADSFEDFSPDEQYRIGEHMKDWAKFSLADQSQARLNYSNASNLSAEEKRRLWEEYQSLSARERKRLAQGGLLRPGGVALAAWSRCLPRPLTPTAPTRPRFCRRPRSASSRAAWSHRWKWARCLQRPRSRPAPQLLRQRQRRPRHPLQNRHRYKRLPASPPCLCHRWTARAHCRPPVSPNRA